MTQSESLDMITKVQLALQAMEVACKRIDELKAENKALKEALAQPEQEPWSNVGIGVDVTKEGVSVVGIYKLSNDSSHLFYSQFYTTPPQRTWVGLTDEEIKELDLSNYVQVVRIVEAKLKDKNL